jgi:hypothetical protein
MTDRTRGIAAALVAIFFVRYSAADDAKTAEAPFKPPATLAELDEQVQWEDRPVLD